MKTRTKRILIISLISLAAVFLAAALYLGDYYRADEGAIAVFDGAENISVSDISTRRLENIPLSRRMVRLSATR